MLRRLRPIEFSKEDVISKQVEPRLPRPVRKQPKYRGERNRDSRGESHHLLPPVPGTVVVHHPDQEHRSGRRGEQGGRGGHTRPQPPPCPRPPPAPTPPPPR